MYFLSLTASFLFILILFPILPVSTQSQYIRSSPTNKPFTFNYRDRLDQISFEACTERCHFMYATCEKIAYMESTRSCYLSDAPWTRSNPNAIQVTEYFLRFRIYAPQTCILVPGFEEVIDREFDGTLIAQIELNQTSLRGSGYDRFQEKCLDECLRSKVDRGVECLSIMWYKHTDQQFTCILHSDYVQNDDQLKMVDSNQTNAGYIVNRCGIQKGEQGMERNVCPSGTASTYIEHKYVQLAISTWYDSYLSENVTLNQCFDQCEHSDNFACRSINYFTLNNSCSLSYVDGRHVYRLNPVWTTNYYERYCIEGANDVCNGSRVSFRSWLMPPKTDETKNRVSSRSLEECLGMCLLDQTKSCKSTYYEMAASSDAKYYGCSPAVVEPELHDIGHYVSGEVPHLDVDGYNSPQYFQSLCGPHQEDTSQSDKSTPYNPDLFCKNGGNWTYAKFTHTLSDTVDVTFENSSLEECFDRCNHEQSITCFGFNYYNASRKCQLSSRYIIFNWLQYGNLIDLIGPRTSWSKAADYYERHCLPGYNSKWTGGEMIKAYTEGVFHDKVHPIYRFYRVYRSATCISLCIQEPTSKCQAVSYDVGSRLCQLYDRYLNRETRGDYVYSQVFEIPRRVTGPNESRLWNSIEHKYSGENLTDITIYFDKKWINLI